MLAKFHRGTGSLLCRKHHINKYLHCTFSLKKYLDMVVYENNYLENSQDLSNARHKYIFEAQHQNVRALSNQASSVESQNPVLHNQHLSSLCDKYTYHWHTSHVRNKLDPGNQLKQSMAISEISHHYLKLIFL